jgi:hypothetical protein
MKIFIVLHHEIMGTSGQYRADEMVFYTSSSLDKALEVIKKSGVCRWSWWEIQVSELDGNDWPEHVGYYGLRGGRLAKPPFAKCVALFEKEGLEMN